MLLSITVNVRLLFFFIRNTSNASAQQRWTTLVVWAKTQFSRELMKTSSQETLNQRHDLAVEWSIMIYSPKEESRKCRLMWIFVHTHLPHNKRGRRRRQMKANHQRKEKDRRPRNFKRYESDSLMMKRRRKWSDCWCSSDRYFLLCISADVRDYKRSPLHSTWFWMKFSFCKGAQSCIGNDQFNTREIGPIYNLKVPPIVCHSSLTLNFLIRYWPAHFVLG